MNNDVLNDGLASHPSRVRGLKLALVGMVETKAVAPITGAWIETVNSKQVLLIQRRTHHGCVD